ncbi:TlyA family RNA methyltransferase [Microvirgula aerodenitrificans]|uniref:TlyA family RNA methyltransferase n=1 Tax=Microvirgula aerodenitrificans TaxID=57480 RepID=UPI00248D4306|nr:TlyA family RNA methyltransferase [Microvirgula aerodenitrificans]
MPRADLLLVELGFASSRTAAQRLIAAGRVSVARHDGAHVLKKPSDTLHAGDDIVVTPDPADRYVSRGALKLAGALAQTGVRVDGVIALDVGQSTGGFTDCLLQAGAARVVGIDVGHGQLHPRIAADPRVVAFEGINARALDLDAIRAAAGAGHVDLIVCDVSFISLTLALPPALPLLASGGVLLSLVKPQFEVGRDGVGGGGIVRDESLYAGVETRIRALLAEHGLQVLHWLDSPILGGDGNREFFVAAVRH